MLNSVNYLKNISSSPGVYFLRDKAGKLLYIGKAINLKRRVSSYFQKKIFDPRLSDLVGQVAKIGYQKTDSAIEALILEANLVKKYQPFYNVKLKDDKTFVNIAISREEFPRVFIMRLKAKRLFKNIKIKKLFGPYPSAGTARTALKILRRIFPFRGLEKTKQAERFYKEIMAISENRENYLESIKNLVLFFQGKKKRLIGNLTKEMRLASQKGEYEEAGRIRDKIFALQHIQDVALLKEADWTEETKTPAVPARIEAYDISNIFGQYATGSMVVFTNGKVDTDEYRLFRIKRKIPLAPFSKGGLRGISDTAMLAEVLERRFKHREWNFPDLMIIDGGIGQLNAVKKVLKNHNIEIPLIGIAKGPTRKGEKLFMTKNARLDSSQSRMAPLLDRKIIVALRDEAHRFAISYHRKLKRKGLWE